LRSADDCGFGIMVPATAIYPKRVKHLDIWGKRVGEAAAVSERMSIAEGVLEAVRICCRLGESHSRTNQRLLRSSLAHYQKETL